jgi:hypothetical protein
MFAVVPMSASGEHLRQLQVACGAYELRDRGVPGLMHRPVREASALHAANPVSAAPGARNGKDQGESTGRLSSPLTAATNPPGLPPPGGRALHPFPLLLVRGGSPTRRQAKTLGFPLTLEGCESQRRCLTRSSASQACRRVRRFSFVVLVDVFGVFPRRGGTLAPGSRWNRRAHREHVRHPLHGCTLGAEKHPPLFWEPRTGTPAQVSGRTTEKTAVKEKTCSHCGQRKEPAEFPRNKRTSDQLRSWCRACVNEARRVVPKWVYLDGGGC